MFTGYKILQEQGGVNPAPQPQAQPAQPQSAAPQPAATQPAQQIKITRGNQTYVVAWIAASKGWCVYHQQPGATKAQLQGKPMPDIKDAVLSVVAML